MQEQKGFIKISVKIPLEKNEKIIHKWNSQVTKQKNNKSKAFRVTLNENIDMETAILQKDMRIKELENNGFENKATSLNGGQALSEPTTENAFDYENWYSDCEYGTYFKDKKKVHCRCTYPSVSKWLPKDRLVDPQVCDNCFPRIQGIKDFVETQREERNALAHTKGYFTNEHGTRIPY